MQRRVRITYQLKDNILTRCFTNGMTNTKQIILPTNHQLKVLELSHDIPLAGYFIVNKNNTYNSTIFLAWDDKGH